jgi:hypothetical protein
MPLINIGTPSNTPTGDTLYDAFSKINTNALQVTSDIASKVNTSDVINTLVSTQTTKPLSAAQGKVLNDKFNLYATDAEVAIIESDLYTAISSVASGSPKGTYANLAALQAAFPTGNTNIYVTLNDGHWYYYNSGWQDGGLYQSALTTTIKSNQSLSLAQRKDDVLYGILDQYTGENITLSKVTGTPTVDGIIYFQLGSEYFKRNYTEINVDWFGCIGNGIVDDTVNIQKALTTDSKVINFTSGKTYLINGGLTSSVANRKINVQGATIKLKNSAAIKTMLTVTGQYTDVIGGTWDGNKANGNSVNISPNFGYDSTNITIDTNNCSVKNIISINTYGMAIKGNGTVSYLLAENNNIKDVELYGIFIDGNLTDNIQVGNKAIGNTIDCSFNPAFTQGILFTSVLTPTSYQSDYEVSGNKVYGSLVATTDQNICIAVRGHRGIFSNNITVGGAMGISEGGDNTIYSNNNISKVSSLSAGYGIETTGSNVNVVGNNISDVKFGVLSSNLNNYDNCIVANNIIKTLSTGTCIKYQIATGFSGKNIQIVGNTLNGFIGIYTTKDVSGLYIAANNIIGTGSSVVGTRGLFLDTPNSAAKVTISGNKISRFERGYSVYSATAITFTNLTAISNDLSDDVPQSSNGWAVEGSAILGLKVISTYGLNNEGIYKNVLDQKNNVFNFYSESINNPEGVLTAGVGSTYVSLNSNGGIYFKLSGIGNTGWQPMYKTYTTMPNQANSTAADVATLVTDFNALIAKLKTAGLMTT